MFNRFANIILGCFVALTLFFYSSEAAVTIKDYPFMVQLRYPGKATVCSGILLSLQHVLTASHCVEYKYNTKKITVVAGTNNRKVGGVVRNIDKIFNHPENDIEAGESNMDVAIVKLKKPFVQKVNIKPLTNLCSANVNVADKINLVGWAEAVDLNDKPLKNITQTLRKVEMPVISLEECSKHFEPIQPGNLVDLENSNGCAYVNTFNNCVVNGGSAVMSGDALCGVNSWCLGCGEGDFPSIFTRIDKVRPFIDEYLKK